MDFVEILDKLTIEFLIKKQNTDCLKKSLNFVLTCRTLKGRQFQNENVSLKTCMTRMARETEAIGNKTRNIFILI